MKNNYFLYNLKGISRMLTPAVFLPKNREKILKDVLTRPDIELSLIHISEPTRPY